MKGFVLFFIVAVITVGCGGAIEASRKAQFAETNAPATSGAPEQQVPEENEPENPLEIVVKLRAYKLSFAGAPTYNSTISETTIKDHIAETNRLYKPAGLRVELESIKNHTVPTSEIPGFTASDTLQTIGGKLGSIRFPANTTGGPLFQVAFFYAFPATSQGSAKGVYTKSNTTAFVGEHVLKTGAANGGIVTAHELGHALSLQHINGSGGACDGNLMCTGGTGIGENLTAEQISDMQDQAAVGPMK